MTITAPLTRSRSVRLSLVVLASSALLPGCLFYGDEVCFDDTPECVNASSDTDGSGGGNIGAPDGSGGRAEQGVGGFADEGSGGNDTGAGGNDVSSGGNNTGTGGLNMGTGGEDMGTGGEDAGSGGNDMGTGGGGQTLVDYGRYLAINEIRHSINFVELYNGSSTALSLDGIGVTLNGDYGNICWLSSLGTIPAYGFAVARAGASCLSGESCVTGCELSIVGNTSIELLYDDSITRHSVSSTTYPASDQLPIGSQSWGRQTDGTGMFAKIPGSPGASNN